jgi:hypothetical protein|tara:strand:+ start:6644 stop:7231 length:588 start_codon:yes stop_codon:yes gene_type:complete
MKNLMLVLVVTLSVFSCKNEAKKEIINEHENHNATAVEDAPKKKVLSPHTAAMAMVGDAHVHIDYSSPGVRDRVIFGGLVGYDNVWQAGAHKATWIETNKDLIINGKVLPKGKYGFFTIPTKGDWILIFNKNWEQHGKDDYDEKDDVLRFTTTPELSDVITEQLTYKVDKISDTEGTITFAWEKVTLTIPFTVKQ